jgi:hypothetical protein
MQSLQIAIPFHGESHRKKFKILDATSRLASEQFAIGNWPNGVHKRQSCILGDGKKTGKGCFEIVIRFSSM